MSSTPSCSPPCPAAGSHTPPLFTRSHSPRVAACPRPRPFASRTLIRCCSARNPSADRLQWSSPPVGHPRSTQRHRKLPALLDRSRTHPRPHSPIATPDPPSDARPHASIARVAATCAVTLRALRSDQIAKPARSTVCSASRARSASTPGPAARSASSPTFRRHRMSALSASPSPRPAARARPIAPIPARPHSILIAELLRLCGDKKFVVVENEIGSWRRIRRAGLPVLRLNPKP